MFRLINAGRTTTRNRSPSLSHMPGESFRLNGIFRGAAGELTTFGSVCCRQMKRTQLAEYVGKERTRL